MYGQRRLVDHEMLLSCWLRMLLIDDHNVVTVDLGTTQAFLPQASTQILMTTYSSVGLRDNHSDSVSACTILRLHLKMPMLISGQLSEASLYSSWYLSVIPPADVIYWLSAQKRVAIFQHREVLLAFTARSTFGRGSSWWIRTTLRRCGERMLIERRHIHMTIKTGIAISYAFNNFIFSSSYTRSTYYTTCWFGKRNMWLMCLILPSSCTFNENKNRDSIDFLWQSQ